LNKNWRELISGKSGEYAFCKDCELNHRCSKKQQKIMDFTTKMINYYLGEEKPFSGNFDEQPKIFNHCQNILAQEEIRILQENKKGK